MWFVFCNLPQYDLDLAPTFVEDTESDSSFCGPSGNAIGSKSPAGGGPSSGIVARQEPPCAAELGAAYLGLYGRSSSP